MYSWAFQEVRSTVIVETDHGLSVPVCPLKIPRFSFFVAMVSPASATPVRDAHKRTAVVAVASSAVHPAWNTVRNHVGKSIMLNFLFESLL